MVIDTHAHLNDEVYTDLDRIISEMENDNLQKIVCASADFEGSKRSVDLANSNKNLYAMIGLHPDNAFEYNEEVKQTFLKLGLNKKVVAIGEIGLDYHTEGFDKELQKKVLIEQLKIAHELKLPVVFHVRDAHEDFLKLIKENKDLLTDGGIIHCFSGSYEFAKEYLNFGFKIAFGGVLTFTNAKKCVEVASKLPLNSMVVETDCPWLCPEPFRGQRNEPKFVNYVVEKLAEVKQIAKLNLEKILLDNTYDVFKKLER